MRRLSLVLSILVLSCLIIPVMVQAQDVILIAYGDSVRGRIDNPDSGVMYYFEAQRGDSVTISAESNAMDVYLRLADSNGDLLAENDDVSGNNTNARINFDVPADGQYVVVVLGYDPGAYVLSVLADGGSSSGGATQPTSDGTTLNYGDQVSGQAFNMDKPVTYLFSGNANDHITINVSSDSVDTYLVLADSAGNTLAENDDISSDDVNSQIDYTLPANGDYLIGVFAYEAGPFTLGLESGSAGGSPLGGDTVPVSDATGVGEVVTGSISDNSYYIEIPITGVSEGQTISIDARATSGDLDLYIGLFFGENVVAENDDRDPNTTDSFIEFPNAAAGDYSLIVSRYGYDKGETSGSFEVNYKVGGGGALVSSSTTLASNPMVAGYPALTVSQTKADWTILAYMGGDNNLEDGLINDVDEFERAGGSTTSVRILTLLDRSGEYDRSNGNWTDTRLFEVGADRSRDFNDTYPPTLDTQAVGDLGEIDTGYGKNLLDFLVWGMETFPARHYAVILNDHGGAWYGTVTDDTTGDSILDLPELQQVFASALQNTGVPKFDLLINDACLMSGVEHYAAISPYFDFAIGSPEITLNPSFDMELLTNTLNQQPNIDIGTLGQMIADKYLQDMDELAPDTSPVLGAVATDLRNFGEVTDAMDAFAEVVATNPRAYASLIGQVRANTYTYSSFLPEDEFGPATNIDVGNFMFRLAKDGRDSQLSEAATNVLSALRDVNIYSTAGSQLLPNTTFYNIYFPARASDFDTGYFEQNPVRSWSELLRAYFGEVRPGTRAFNPAAATNAGVGAPPLAPSLVPIVSVTNVFPSQISINVPVKVSMEVTGRNITRGTFTVDQLQADGTLVRMQTSPIVTEVVEDGVVNFINLWNPGVDDSNFNWDALLPVVTDGQTTHFEQVVSSDNQDTLAGRYRFPGESNWIDVAVMFNDDGTTANVVSKNAQSSALASIRLDAGGEFQTYRSQVTPDGRVELNPGTTFIWPEDGISWRYEPAPSGEYQLGFLVEAAGGSTGFGSASVMVDNNDAMPDLRGYLDSDWGFVMQRPADWYSVSYFPDSDFLQTSAEDSSAYLFVYPVYETSGGDLQAIAQSVLDKYELNASNGFRPITVDDRDALEFNFTYTNDKGKFVSQAFSVYLSDLDLGLVFSSEALTKGDMNRNYALFNDYLFFFDVATMKNADTGVWAKDTYGDNVRYPVPETWMPGAENGLWWTYTPDGSTNSTTFASVTVLNPMDKDSEGVLDVLLAQEVESLSAYTVLQRDVYYAELNTWSVVTYTREVRGQTVMGRLYAMVKDDGVPYALWFEAPQADFESLFRDQFTVLLDGFHVEVPVASAS